MKYLNILVLLTDLRQALPLMNYSILKQVIHIF